MVEGLPVAQHLGAAPAPTAKDDGHASAKMLGANDLHDQQATDPLADEWRYLRGVDYRHEFHRRRIYELPKRINGGTIGLEERMAYWQRARKALAPAA